MQVIGHLHDPTVFCLGKKVWKRGRLQSRVVAEDRTEDHLHVINNECAIFPVVQSV
jgi:hypothetical protein